MYNTQGYYGLYKGKATISSSNKFELDLEGILVDIVCCAMSVSWLLEPGSLMCFLNLVLCLMLSVAAKKGDAAAYSKGSGFLSVAVKKGDAAAYSKERIRVIVRCSEEGRRSRLQ